MFSMKLPVTSFRDFPYVCLFSWKCLQTPLSVPHCIGVDRSPFCSLSDLAF